MQETPNDISDMRWLKLLRLFCFATLLIPSVVLVICEVLMILNSNAGWLRYPLHPIFLIAYVLTGLTSPLVGIAALIVLGVTRQKFKNEAGRKLRSLKIHILFLGLVDILIVIAWLMLFPRVFFMAGGSR